jgi:hypothetical protein
LDKIDLDEEIKQRDFSTNLPREVKVTILCHIWNEVETAADRPLKQLFPHTFDEEMQSTRRQIGAIEHVFRKGVVHENKVWTLTFQATWAFYRQEERAIQENLLRFVKLEDKLRDIMAELRSLISWENQLYDEL